MDNFKQPAYPHICYEITENGQTGMYTSSNGFTKLEKAALMIAGHIAGSWGNTHGHEKRIAELSVAIAESVLEECNK